MSGAFWGFCAGLIVAVEITRLRRQIARLIRRIETLERGVGTNRYLAGVADAHDVGVLTTPDGSAIAVEADRRRH